MPYQSPRRRRVPAPSFDRTRAEMFKLLACLVILGALLLIKILDPSGAERLRSVMSGAVGGGADVEQAMSALGRAIRDGETRLGLSLWPSESVDGVADGASDPNELDEPAVVQSPSPTATPSPEVTLSSEVAIETSPLTVSPWDVGLQSADTDDDTLPLPFLTEKPEQVDFTVYPMEFARVWPVQGEITSTFGYRMHPIIGELRFHFGLDMAADTGTPIVSFAEGTVTATGYTEAYGNYIIVRHSEGYSTLYGHCDTILAKEDQTVTTDTVIARVGNTGISTGPHLHLEVHRAGLLLDPQNYLPV